MRISDWSSDVCSSDLPSIESIKFTRLCLIALVIRVTIRKAVTPGGDSVMEPQFLIRCIDRQLAGRPNVLILIRGIAASKLNLFGHPTRPASLAEIGSASCRERVCQSV